MAPIDLFDLYCKITIDDGEFARGIENVKATLSGAKSAFLAAGESANNISDGIIELGESTEEAAEKTSIFGDVLKANLTSEAIITGVKAIGKTIEDVASKVVDLTKASIGQYGEYEQLVGGVETLFKTSADIVQGYAANAYKTAGLSANEYMETVTSFSASLLQSLENDTEAAAEKADLAITDMSDNANKMGTSMESIQNAYQGFAKANYTMLDNLKLGYGGTKEEMERLLEDATALSGVEYDISSYADIVDAIHVIQTEMGITGTTALEASTTIQGSISSAISTWKNLVTGIADEDADLDTLIGNFVGSVETAAGNVIPRIAQILSGMGTAIQQLAPIIATEVPALVSSVLPQIISAGAQLAVGLATGLIGALPELAAAVPEIVSSLSAAISESLPELTAAGTQLLSMLAAGVMTGIPLLAETAAGILVQLGQYLKENLPTLLQSGLEMLDEFTGSLRENAGVLVDAALEFAKNLAVGLAAGIPTIIEQVPGIVSNIANIINDNAPKMLSAAAEIIGQLVIGLLAAIPTLVANIPEIVTAIWNVITAVNWVNLGANIIQGIGNGIKSMGSFAKSSMETIKTALKDGVSKLPETFLEIGKNIIQGLIDGVKSMASAAVQAVKDVGGSIVSSITDFLGIHSPSTVFADIGKYMILGLEKGWEDNFGLVKSDITNSLDFGTANVDFASSGLGMSSAGIINSVSSGFAESSGIGNATFVLQLENGSKIASWLLSDLIKAGAANGTPIASGQYA